MCRPAIKNEEHDKVVNEQPRGEIHKELFSWQLFDHSGSGFLSSTMKEKQIARKRERKTHARMRKQFFMHGANKENKIKIKM
jgi:hypothetical protein